MRPVRRAGWLPHSVKSCDTLATRLCIVFAGATMPLVAAALTTAPKFAVIATWVIGLVLMGGGAVLVASRPLARLNRAIAGWRLGTSFIGKTDRRRRLALSRDLRRLVVAFHRATLVLQRQQADLEQAVEQQGLLMQETHHRVKNNLQIVASLLNLQASRIRLPEARAEFQSARDRVRALATLHRHLYAHGEVHTINMREFLTELCGQLFQAMGEKAGERLRLEIEAPELKMSSDQAVPLALIVTEAVSNAVKYAFPDGRRGSVSVRLTADADYAELEIDDDGVGIPAGRVETDAGTRDGIGLQLIRGFVRQLGATLSVEEGSGTHYKVILPLRQERLDSLMLKGLSNVAPA